MQYIKGLENYINTNPTAITIGKFDGLHRGHELLLSNVMKHAKEDRLDSVVLAFDLAPFYNSHHMQQRSIMTGEERKERLDGRVDYLVECPLDETIAGMDAREFVEEILVGKFHVSYLAVGTDFRFGFQKQGDYHLLQSLSRLYGYHVDVLEKKCHNGREISSTYIKEALEQKDYKLADELLGYSYKFL